MSTAMAAHSTDPKMQPADLADAVLTGVENDAFEVIADELTTQVKAGLAAPIDVLYPELRGTAR